MELPQWVCVIYPGEDQAINIITWSEAVKASHRAGSLVKQSLEASGVFDSTSRPRESMPLAILANSGNIGVLISMTHKS